MGAPRALHDIGGRRSPFSAVAFRISTYAPTPTPELILLSSELQLSGLSLEETSLRISSSGSSMVGRRIWRRSFAVAREDVSSPYESGLESDGCGTKVVREQGEKVQRGAVVVPGLAVGVQVRGCVYRSVVVRWGGQRRSLAAKLDEAQRVLVVVLGGAASSSAP